MEKQNFQIALRRIARKETSSQEMRRYLEKQKIPADEIESVIDRLISLNYLDDQRYTRALIRTLGRQGKGPLQLVQKLRMKGIDLSLNEVNQLLKEELEEWNEVALAQQLVQRRYPKAFEDSKIYRRAFQALIRRGFSTEVIQKCLKPVDE